MNKIKAQQAVKLAEGNAWQAKQPERANADLCLADAKKCLERGHYRFAIERAAKSLSYSIGAGRTFLTALGIEY